MKKVLCALFVVIMFTFVLSSFAQAKPTEEGKMYAELKNSQGQVVKDTTPGSVPAPAPGYGYDSAYNPGYNPY
jgi:hypothetical protein